jgi:L-amino acid N-acyltransferase YncA
MSDLVIRPARPADIPAIAAIYAPAVMHGTASFELEPPDDADMLRRFEQITGGSFPYLAATRDDKLLGYAYVNHYRTRPAYRFVVENSIYVEPLAQGQGIGGRLLAALIAASTERGFRQMIAVIGDSQQTGSIALHRAAGFTFCGTLHSVGFKFDRWIDSVYMQRALGTGDTTPPDQVSE